MNQPFGDCLLAFDFWRLTFGDEVHTEKWDNDSLFLAILRILQYLCKTKVRPEVAEAIIQPSEEVSESAVPSAVA